MFRSITAIGAIALLAGCAGGWATPMRAPLDLGALALGNEDAAHCPAYAKGSGLLADGDFHQAVDPGSYYLTFYKGQRLAPLWAVTVLNVNFIGTKFWNFAGLCSIDLDGQSAVGGIKHHAFSTKKGASYALSFLMSGNSDCAPTTKKMKVVVGNRSAIFTWDTSRGHNVRHGVVATRRLKFTASGASSTLSFTSLDPTGSGCGPIVGAVAVTAN